MHRNFAILTISLPYKMCVNQKIFYIWGKQRVQPFKLIKFIHIFQRFCCQYPLINYPNQRPYEIDPCRHTFCQSCLIRLIQAGRSNCPICRGAMNGTKLNIKLHLALLTQNFDDYGNRYIVELKSGIYDIPMNRYVQLEARLEALNDRNVQWEARLEVLRTRNEEAHRARQNWIPW